VGRCCTAYDQSYATFDSTLICWGALVCHMNHFFAGIQPPVRRVRRHSNDSIQPIYAAEALLGRCRATPVLPCYLSFASVSHPRIYCSSLYLVHDNLVYMTDPDRGVCPYWLADNWGRFFPRDGMWLAIAACLWLHAPVSLSVSECVWSKKDLCSRALYASCMVPLPSFCICTPGKEVGWIMRL